MKVLKGVSLLLVVLLQTLGTVQFAQATEGDDNRHRLCTKFPLNSRCQGFTPAIALDDRPGTEAKCLFRGDEKASVCKVMVSESQMSLFTEFGGRLRVLEGEKDTQESIIPLESIESFYYSEQKKTDVGAVIAFGLPGLLAKIKTATIDLRYRSAEEAEDTDNLVIVSRRKYGRELRSVLEKSTGLSARTVVLD